MLYNTISYLLKGRAVENTKSGFCDRWNELLRQLGKWDTAVFTQHVAECNQCAETREDLLRKLEKAQNALLEMMKRGGGNGDPPGSVGGSDF